MKLSTKILILIALMTAAVILALGYVIVDLKQQQEAILQNIQRVIKLNGYNSQLAILQNQIDENTLSYRFKQDPVYLTRIAHIQALKASTLDKMSPLVEKDRFKELVKTFLKNKDESELARNDLIGAIQKKDAEEIGIHFERWQLLNQSVDASLADLNQFNITTITTTVEKVKDIRSKVSIIITATILLSVLMAIFLYYILRHLLIIPLRKISDTAKLIARGEFNQLVDYKSSDEVGVLAQEINAMATQLKSSYQNLETKVRERTEELEKAKLTAEERASEAERLNNVMADRELKMIELKQEIAGLNEELREKGIQNETQ